MGRIQNPVVVASLIIQALIGIRDDQISPVGIPSPYYDYEQTIRIANGLLKDNISETFLGTSYSLKSFLELFIRRNCRQLIVKLWRRISHTQYAEMVPSCINDCLLWRTYQGKLETRFPNQTQIWSELFENSRKIDLDKIPTILQTNLYWLPLFLTVYPHRLNTDLVSYVDLRINSHLFQDSLQSKS